MNGMSALFDVVDGPEAVGQPAGVHQHDGTDRATGDVVPHEPEAVLARRAEQVQDQVLGKGDPAEVHGDRRGRLVRQHRQVVDRYGRLGHQRLGAQRLDLADRSDQGRLADAEAAGDDDLDREGIVDGVGTTATSESTKAIPHPFEHTQVAGWLHRPL